MTDDFRNELHRACLTLERYRLETYSNIEISCISRDDEIILIKPMGECDVHKFHLDSLPSEIPSTKLHAELYSRFGDISSILLVNSEWISIASGAGWTLDRQSYGYIPSFTDTVPCTARIRTPADSDNYPEALCDAISTVIAKDKPPRSVLVRGIGALVFSGTPMAAAEYAVTLEYAAKKAFHIRKFR